MTDLTPEGVVRGYFEALNARDFARAAGPIAEDCEWTSIATEKTHRGPAAIVAGLREFVAAFPDWRVDLERVTTAGSIVIVEWDTSGTFQKPFRGQQPNGRRFRRRGCAVADVEGGRIVRYRDYYDRATLLDQLALAP
ncbi:MAG: ester cyclase [Usitatibacter sp.]